jgi:hypothetical protein
MRGRDNTILSTQPHNSTNVNVAPIRTGQHDSIYSATQFNKCERGTHLAPIGVATSTRTGATLLNHSLRQSKLRYLIWDSVRNKALMRSVAPIHRFGADQAGPRDRLLVGSTEVERVPGQTV